MKKVNTELKNNIPYWAKSLVEKNPANLGLIEDFDSSNNHQPKWHEFGIWSHTLKVEELFLKDLANILDNKTVLNKVNLHFDELIGEKSKRELFHASVLLHDIGKWNRKIKLVDNQVKPDYSDHEKIGSDIVLGYHDSKEVNHFLKQILSQPQIEYIADCVATHYELGHIRKIVKQSEIKYDIDTPKSELFINSVKHIKNKFPHLFVEIGVYFLIDNLGKTSKYFVLNENNSTQNIEVVIDDYMKKNKIPEILREAYLETPIAFAIGNSYLNIVIS